MNIKLTAYNKRKSICYPVGTELLCKKENVDGNNVLRLYDGEDYIADVVRDVFDDALIVGSIPALCIMDNLPDETSVIVTKIGQVNAGQLNLALIVDVEIKKSNWVRLSSVV